MTDDITRTGKLIIKDLQLNGPFWSAVGLVIGPAAGAMAAAANVVGGLAGLAMDGKVTLTPTHLRFASSRLNTLYFGKRVDLSVPLSAIHGVRVGRKYLGSCMLTLQTDGGEVRIRLIYGGVDEFVARLHAALGS